jgi:light-regulated signal transduction histidine kinase (bacteriophytochrome)
MTLQKQAADELVNANARLEEFASITSHDLQEPLRMVIGYLQLLNKRYKGRLDADADEFIGYAVEGAQRMEVLIRDVLRFSRVGHSDRPLKPADCNELLRTAIQHLELSLEENQATLTHDPLPVITGDAVELVQIFQNLVSNAIKYRSEVPPRVHIGVEERDEDWLFCVKDNGIGFDQQQHAERIFGIFKRLPQQKEYPGTGIGLAICKRIVESHGGTIWAESQIAKGSTFYFTIPKNRRPV